MSETPTRSNIDALRLARRGGVPIEDFHLQTSQVGGVIGYIRATVTAKNVDGTPTSVQFSSHEILLPQGQAESLYPVEIKQVLARIRSTAAALQ